MKLSIYNTYIPVTSQEMADRLKQICLDNALPIWDEGAGFHFISGCIFMFNDNVKEFYCVKAKLVIDNIINNKTEITEEKFINLLKTLKNE